MSDGFWRSLNSLIYGGSSFVSFACEIAILVVISTIVRRHRPDAYQGLQLWAIGSLVVFVIFIRGLAALAQPPKPIVVEGLPPYR